MAQTIQERFWSKVSKGPDCWNWTASLVDGYGYIRKDSHEGSIKARAHRVSWEWINGKIPNNAMVLHSCDNRACVRPEHLFLGNGKINMQDCLKKGRYNPKHGEAHHFSKLTKKDIFNIKYFRLKGEKIAKLSEKYNISTTQVYRVLNGSSWKHLNNG